MKKEIGILGGIVVVVIGLGFILFQTSDKPVEEITLSDGIVGGAVLTRDDSHRIGSNEAKVTLVEFGDFQCPACAAVFPQVKQIKETYKDNPDFTFVFRHFPLVSIHKNAMISARAVEAANLQGKFWELHDLLYSRQTEWATDINPTDRFVTYASELGLNTEQFRKDLSSQKVADTVAQDLKDAEALRLRGTPTFYLNGEQLGAFSDLKALIDQAIIK